MTILLVILIFHLKTVLGRLGKRKCDLLMDVLEEE